MLRDGTRRWALAIALGALVECGRPAPRERSERRVSIDVVVRDAVTLDGREGSPDAAAPDDAFERDVVTALDATLRDAGAPAPHTTRSRLHYGESGPCYCPSVNIGPTVTLGTLIVRGAVPPLVAQRIIRRQIGQVAFCYEREMQSHESLAGHVVVRFLVGANGVVSTSEVLHNLADVPAVGECIANAARRWEWPVEADGGSTLVTAPFALRAEPPEDPRHGHMPECAICSR